MVQRERTRDSTERAPSRATRRVQRSDPSSPHSTLLDRVHLQSCVETRSSSTSLSSSPPGLDLKIEWGFFTLRGFVAWLHTFSPFSPDNYHLINTLPSTLSINTLKQHFPPNTSPGLNHIKNNSRLLCFRYPKPTVEILKETILQAMQARQSR